MVPGLLSSIVWFMQGPVEYRQEVLDYFQRMGVSIILLRRRNVLKRLISIMANDFDRREKLLNGTHKAHVHSLEEVPFFSLICRAYFLAFIPELLDFINVERSDDVHLHVQRSTS